MNMASAVATIDNDPVSQRVKKLSHQLEQRAPEMVKALPSHIDIAKFQRTIVTAVQTDPSLLDCDRQSLILSCMKAAQDGLLPDKREAALVVFTRNVKDGNNWIKVREVQYMPMVYGLRKKILQSGEVQDITAKVVYRREVEEGFFIYEEGTDSMLRHRPMLDLTADDATDDNIVAAYSMATYKDGTKSYEVMRRFEIDKVREASQTGATRDKKGQPRNSSGPWVDWYPEQAKKTVMRRHSKTLPMSGDLVDVEARDDSLYAGSASMTLSAGTGGEPARLPSRDDAASASQIWEDDDHHHQEGRAPSGIGDRHNGTDDEETARHLDEVFDPRTGEITSGDDAGPDWTATVASIKAEMEARTTAPDVNSYWSSIKALVEDMPDAMRDEIENAKAARILAIRKG